MSAGNCYLELGPQGEEGGGTSRSDLGLLSSSSSSSSQDRGWSREFEIDVRGGSVSNPSNIAREEVKANRKGQLQIYKLTHFLTVSLFISNRFSISVRVCAGFINRIKLFFGHPPRPILFLKVR